LLIWIHVEMTGSNARRTGKKKIGRYRVADSLHGKL